MLSDYFIVYIIRKIILNINNKKIHIRIYYIEKRPYNDIACKNKPAYNDIFCDLKSVFCEIICSKLAKKGITF